MDVLDCSKDSIWLAPYMIEEGVTVCPYAVSVFEKYLEKCSYKSLCIVSNRKPPIRIKALIATFFILSIQLMRQDALLTLIPFLKHQKLAISGVKKEKLSW